MKFNKQRLESSIVVVNQKYKYDIFDNWNKAEIKYKY